MEKWEKIKKKVLNKIILECSCIWWYRYQQLYVLSNLYNYMRQESISSIHNLKFIQCIKPSMAEFQLFSVWLCLNQTLTKVLNSNPEYPKMPLKLLMVSTKWRICSQWFFRSRTGQQHIFFEETPSSLDKGKVWRPQTINTWLFKISGLTN